MNEPQPKAPILPVLGDSWVMDSGKQDPASVDACPADWRQFEKRPFARLQAAK